MGAVIIERNVLQWRLDPTSRPPCPLRTATGRSSSFASRATPRGPGRRRTLDCGLRDVNDLVGGHDAWAAHHADATAQDAQLSA